MELFYRRPLCFFCCLFLITSALAAYSHIAVLSAIYVLLATVAVLLVLTAVLKNKRILLISVMLCIIFVLGAFTNHYFRIQTERAEALEYVGNRSVHMYIIECEYESQYSSAYIVEIDEISGKDTSVKAMLVMAFPIDLNIGDTLRGGAVISDAGSEIMGMTANDINKSSDILLSVAVYSPEKMQVKQFDSNMPLYKKLTAENGIRVIISEAKESIGARINKLFGEDNVGLSKGFLLGDRSDISVELIRDFRRTGLSHLFAVSGMHISIFLGGIDLLLKKFYVHKYIRCVIVSALALPMLAITGFAMSAVRSVFMLWLVYIVFMVSEETDPPTILFTAIMLILLIYPYAVYDLGMWLSFFATLGLVTVYPYFDGKIPHIKSENKLKVFIGRLCRAILMIALMTISCGMFLLPLQWYVFGELSLVSVLANILLSPLSTVFMIAIIVALAFGGIPIAGACFSATVKATGSLIELIVRALSSIDIATVSLRYEFTGVLIALFSISFVILVAVKLKRKWLALIPAVSFAVVFTICVSVYSVENSQKITYYGEKTNEFISVTTAQTLVITDLSSGACSEYFEIMSDAMSSGCTEVDKLIFTRITQYHLSSMDYFFRSNIVNDIYIMMPEDDTELERAVYMAALANRCGVGVHLYESGEVFKLDKGELCVTSDNIGDKQAVSVFVSTGEKIFGYTDALICFTPSAENINALLSECDTVIIGNNGVPEDVYYYDIADGTSLIYASEEIYKRSTIHNPNGKNYCNKNDKITLLIDMK